MANGWVGFWVGLSFSALVLKQELEVEPSGLLDLGAVKVSRLFKIPGMCFIVIARPGQDDLTCPGLGLQPVIVVLWGHVGKPKMITLISYGPCLGKGPILDRDVK